MRSAFTLIEILIVVILLGILAAIVVPMFTDASEDTYEAAMQSDLAVLNKMASLYDAQKEKEGWADLVDGDAGGALQAAGLLQTVPTNDKYTYSYSTTTKTYTATAAP